MPPQVISYDAELAREAYSLAEAWHLGDVMGIGISEPPEAVKQTNLSSWTPDQVCKLLSCSPKAKLQLVLVSRMGCAPGSRFSYRDFLTASCFTS